MRPSAAFFPFAGGGSDQYVFDYALALLQDRTQLSTTAVPLPEASSTPTRPMDAHALHSRYGLGAGPTLRAVLLTPLPSPAIVRSSTPGCDLCDPRVPMGRANHLPRRSASFSRLAPRRSGRARCRRLHRPRRGVERTGGRVSSCGNRQEERSACLGSTSAWYGFSPLTLTAPR